MIDWLYVAVNCLWILGLATVVAAFSFHNWQRQVLDRPLAVQLRERSWQLSLGAGLSLVGLSIAVMPRTERWYTRLAALSFAIGCAWLAARAWRRGKKVEGKIEKGKSETRYAGAAGEEGRT